MNSLIALCLWTLLAATIGSLSSIPLLPENSGDPVPEIFRKGLKNNLGIVSKIQEIVRELEEAHILAPPRLNVNKLGYQSEFLSIRPGQTRTCLMSEFQLEMCLNDILSGLQQYDSLLRSPVIVKHLGNHLQRLEELHLDITNLRTNLQELMKFSYTIEAPYGSEQSGYTLPSYQGHFQERVSVYFVLKHLQEFSNRIFWSLRYISEK
ncbi:granulocyte colony-stimulating factor-like [Callorhinchus milii]|uniref:granulocyte colony-stimulating factor-like n=1 Tax=Callorhinchus milii TaxID=7868 RepID=UPI001C3FB3EC|nr:granulocyte colony-stimulating factor-like [Callorhinchus milii]